MNSRPHILLVLLVSLTGTGIVTGQEAIPEFDLFSPSEMSRYWNPNPSLWLDLTTTRTNISVSLGRTDFRMTGPLVNALRPAPRPATERPSRGKRLLAVPLGLLSLAVPQKMPVAPDNGGPGYVAWRGESGAPWEATAMRRPSRPGSADNPILSEPTGKLISIGKQ